MSLLLLFGGSGGEFHPVAPSLRFELPTPSLVASELRLTPSPQILTLSAPAGSYASDYAAAVVADGASNYWKLDDTGGTAVDAIGGAHGTISGGVTKGVPGALSDSSKGMTFDGTSGKIATASASVPLATFTVEAWVKTSAAAIGQIVSTRGSAPAPFVFYKEVAGQVGIYLAGAGLITSGWSINTGRWQHVAAVVNGTARYLYIDGALANSAQSTAGVGSSVGAVGIGWDAQTGQWWNGSLDEVAIYPVALTAAQIAKHYRLGRPTYASTVIGHGASNYWRLDDTGATAVDVVGGKDGAITGGVTRGASGALADPANRALTFNGSTGKATTAAGVVVPASATIEAWFETTAAPFRTMFSNGGGSNWVSVGIGSSGGTKLYIYGAALRYGTRAVTAGWHHAAFVLDGSTVAIYFDGAIDTTQAFVRASATGIATIGSEGNGNYWSGSLDEVAIYPRALTAAEIAEHYALRTAAPVGGTILEIGVQAPPQILKFTPPTPAVLPSGIALIQPTPQSLVFSSGAAGLSIDLTQGIISIGGVARSDVLRKSLSITDVLDEQPNTCGFTIDGGAKPLVGQEVIIGVGSINNRVFAGHLTRVDQTYEGKRSNIRWDCEAIDYTRLLDRRLVIRRYPKQSATAIAIDLVTRFTTGFTTAYIATGLPEIDTIDFTDEQPTQALTRIAKLIGGYWYVDYDRAIHLFITETVDAPDDIDELHLDVRAFDGGADLTQVRTRVYVEGYGSTAVADIEPPGTGTIPVDDAVYYGDGSVGSGGFDGQRIGFVKSGPQHIGYEGKDDGGLGTIVRGADGPGPGSAPTAAVAGGGGGVIGTVYYRVSFKAGSGETTVGPISNAVTGYPFQEPTYGPNIQPAPGVGKLAGWYWYGVTFVTQHGETTGGNSGASFIATAVAGPASPPYVEEHGTGPLVGRYRYQQTYITAEGESLPSASAETIADAVPAPPQPAVVQVSNVWGQLRPGTYQWAVSYVTDDGETMIGNRYQYAIGSWYAGGCSVAGYDNAATSGGILPGDSYQWAVAYVDENGGVSYLGNPTAGYFQISGVPAVVTLNIPLGPTGTAARRIYRRTPGNNNWRWVGDQPDNLATQFPDRSPAGGAYATGAGTMGGVANVTVPAIPYNAFHPEWDRVRKIRIYRSKVNDGSRLFFVGEVLGSTSPQTLVDDTPDAGLSETPPGVSTAGGEQFQITIYGGPSGVLGRRLYRSKADGFDFHLLTEAQGNFNSTFVDKTPDDALTGVAPPYESAAGGQNAYLTNLPQGVAGTLGRRIYRTRAGGGEYFFVTQISDNTTTTYLDSKLDSELGESAPFGNTAGGAVIQVSNLPIGPAGVTARRLYRTQAGGGVFYFVDEIADNITTSVLDDRSDRELGDVPAPETGTLGALIGDTSLGVGSVIPFWVTGGWAYVGNQVIRYGWHDAGTLTLYGIPATGEGSIIAPIKGGDEILSVPMLRNVFGLLYPIKKGDTLNVLVYVDDAAAQAALAATEGGDGIHEHLLQDNRLAIASCRTRAIAELAQFAKPEIKLSFTSRDPKLRSGKTIHIALGPPTNISGDYKIQQVTIDSFDIPGKLPLRHVTASNYLFSLEHILRRVELGD